MASRLLNTCFHFAKISPTVLGQTTPVLATAPFRNASKKSAGVVRNRIGRPNKKKAGIRQRDGDFVHKGDILVKRLGLKYYPGENVVPDEEGNLRAAYDGMVVVSSEQLEPYPDSPLYEHVQKGLVMYKQFYNVIPTPLHGKFKLVSQT